MNITDSLTTPELGMVMALCEDHADVTLLHQDHSQEQEGCTYTQVTLGVEGENLFGLLVKLGYFSTKATNVPIEFAELLDTVNTKSPREEPKYTEVLPRCDFRPRIRGGCFSVAVHSIRRAGIGFRVTTPGGSS